MLILGSVGQCLSQVIDRWACSVQSPAKWNWINYEPRRRQMAKATISTRCWWTKSQRVWDVTVSLAILTLAELNLHPRPFPWYSLTSVLKVDDNLPTNETVKWVLMIFIVRQHCCLSVTAALNLLPSGNRKEERKGRVFIYRLLHSVTIEYHVTTFDDFWEVLMLLCNLDYCTNTVFVWLKSASYTCILKINLIHFVAKGHTLSRVLKHENCRSQRVPDGGTKIENPAR